jgi:hypothetical protein
MPHPPSKYRHYLTMTVVPPLIDSIKVQPNLCAAITVSPPLSQYHRRRHSITITLYLRRIHIIPPPPSHCIAAAIFSYRRYRMVPPLHMAAYYITTCYCTGTHSILYHRRITTTVPSHEFHRPTSRRRLHSSECITDA